MSFPLPWLFLAAIPKPFRVEWFHPYLTGRFSMDSIIIGAIITAMGGLGAFAWRKPHGYQSLLLASGAIALALALLLGGLNVGYLLGRFDQFRFDKGAVGMANDVMALQIFSDPDYKTVLVSWWATALLAITATEAGVLYMVNRQSDGRSRKSKSGTKTGTKRNSKP